MPSSDQEPLVHIRTPTYKRSEALRRCLLSMQDQTWQNWVCDVYDDDPEGSARTVCEGINDPRVSYNQNTPQKFASKNIDSCFARRNPHNADYFVVLEDDNYFLPGFIEENIGVCRDKRVNLVLRNQYIEFDTETPKAALSSNGILDQKFVEQTYSPNEFRLAIISDIGVSNGGLFWSRNAQSQLEIGFSCDATLQEYMRTFSVFERIHVAMKPLAVWADNGEQTTRNLGDQGSFVRRELDMKRSIQILQRQAWSLAGSDLKRSYLKNDAFKYTSAMRASGLTKSLILQNVFSTLPAPKLIELIARGLLIRTVGRPTSDINQFIASRVA